MKRSLLLIVAIFASPAFAQDGGVDSTGRSTDSMLVLDVKEAHILLTDGTDVQVWGGAWVPDDKLMELAKERANLRAQNASLQSDLFKFSAIAVAVLIAAAGAAYGIGRASAKQP